MTRKVGVIGMGNVGSTVAHYIVAMGFADDLVQMHLILKMRWLICLSILILLLMITVR